MTAGARTGRDAASPRLPGRLRLAIWLRSLTLQASWNMQRMQSLGLLYALEPWRRRQWPSRSDRRRFWRRHLALFNTNPYGAGMVIGWLARAEETAGGDDSRLLACKNSLARAVAALGDQLFWLGLHPLLSATAVLLAWWGAGGWAVAPVAAFAVAQLWFRYRLLDAGYRAGDAVPALLAHPAWHRAIALAKRLGAVMTGLLLGAVLRYLPWRGPAGDTGEVPLGFAVCLAVALVARRRWPGEAVLLVMVPLALALAAH